MSRTKTLSEEDRVLWSLVARSAVPLKGRKEPEPPPQPAAPPQVPASPSAIMPAPSPPAPKQQRVSSHFDRPTREKLARGRLEIEGRVDLHGLTQAEAHALLFSFLASAHRRGARYVLVITGKGSSSRSDGVLRRAVPGWLASPSFRVLVSSHEEAARQHGGAGALYVRLRRERAVPR